MNERKPSEYVSEEYSKQRDDPVQSLGVRGNSNSYKASEKNKGEYYTK